MTVAIVQKMLFQSTIASNKVTHWRVAGSMYCEEHGAKRSEITGLGRWFDEHMECSSVCARSYLKNLPPGALVAAAGFIAGEERNSKEYLLPRSRAHDVTDIHSLLLDPDMKRVMSFLFPNCLENAINAENPKDFYSATNEGFTKLIASSVASWIQDSVVLLEKYPTLIAQEPYKFLTDKTVLNAYKRNSRRVNPFLNEPPVDCKAMIERKDVIDCIKYSSMTTKKEMMQLPRQILNEIKHDIGLWAESSRDGMAFSENVRDEASQIGGESSEMLLKDSSSHPQEGLSRNTMYRAEPETTKKSTFQFQKFDTKQIPIVEIVREWDQEIVQLKSIPTNQRQEKEKRKLFYHVLLKRSQKKNVSLTAMAQEFKEKIKSFDGTIGDGEALCRKGKKNDEFDILDESNIKEIVKKRKDKQKGQDDSRKMARLDKQQGE